MNKRQEYEIRQQTRQLRATHGGVAPVRVASICKRCRRELVIAPMARANGRVEVRFTCPKHGTLQAGETYAQAYVAAT